MICVFGSLNVDLSFALPRLPVPGETVLSDGCTTGPGGKGLNQAVAAARAGARVAMHGCVGADPFADLLGAAMRAAGVDMSGVAVGTLPTGCAAIAVDADGRNQIMVASGANRAARAAQVADAALSPATTVVLQLEVPIAETVALARRARRHGARVVLNAAPAAALPQGALDAVDVLVVNEIEAGAIARASGATAAADPVAAGRFLAGRFAGTCVVTLGAAGAVAFTGATGWRIGALAVRPVDTVGAGDAFVGVLAARLDDGDALPAALRWAGVAGGLACLGRGAAAALPDRAALAAALPGLAPAIPA
ncbi:MAG: ribokinase [Alphaproteobacteria bacterium]|nr:ribokinase [Alphaproteobacteria bacterium]